MADDTRKTPAPRPRRRRKDLDPTYVEPKVANERRRSKTQPAAIESGAAAPSATSSEPSVNVDPTPGSGADTPPATDAVVADPALDADATALDADVLATPEGGAPDATSPDRSNDATRPFVVPGARDADAVVVAAGIASSGSAGEAWLPMLEDRSPDPSICPFLRAVDGQLVGAPVEAPDASNRCAALREAVPQSLRQQELVCLTSGHVNCPRYLRGAAAVSELPAATVGTGRSVTPAVFGSLMLLIGAFVLSVGFVASRGGLELTAVATASPSAPAVAAVPSVSVSAVPSAAAATPSPTVVATATPSPTPAPAATPSPSPTASAIPTSAPTPTPTTKPKPSSARYALLTACPNTSKCWIYKVRGGDNVYSIANYFGVRLARVYAMNPWLESSGLRAGQSLRLPPPTR